MKTLLTTLTFTLSLALALAADTPETQDIELLDGTVLEAARVITSSPVDLMIRHSAGLENIPLARFPGEIQERYGYDSEAAAQYRAERAEREAANAARTEARLAELRERERLRREREALRRHIAANTMRVEGTVIQVLDDGLLIDASVPIRGPRASGMASIGLGGNLPGRPAASTPSATTSPSQPPRGITTGRIETSRLNPEPVQPTGQLPAARGIVYLTGIDTTDLTDGIRVRTYAYRDGTHQYTTVLGARSTVPRFRFLRDQ